MTDGKKEDKNTAWFDPLYQKAEGDAEHIPWARMKPHPEFSDWVRLHPAESRAKGKGQRALVVGCGLGDDAEELVRLGFDVTAFDISQTAIGWCQQRFPESKVDYQVADLFAPPPDWRAGFDFVLEIYTIQALPLRVRPDAIRAIMDFVVPGGMLLAVCHGRPTTEREPEGPPWPVSREELNLFIEYGLRELSFEENHSTGTITPVYYRALFQRP